jgi:predicted dehydrogenase
MEKVRVVFIGCGGIARYHANHLKQMDDVQVVAVADPMEDRTRSFQEMFPGAKAYKNHREVLADLDELKPHAAYICIPPFAHDDLTEIGFIEKGLALYVEKPMALDINKAKKVRDKIMQYNAVTSVGFQLRYLSFLNEAKRFVERFRPATIYANRIGGLPGVYWFNNYDMSGGQLVEQNIHTVDMLRYIFGDIKRVYGVAANNYIKMDNYDIDDHSTCLFTFKSGAIVTVNTGCYIPPRKKNQGLELNVERSTPAPNYNHIMMISDHAVGLCDYFSSFTEWLDTGESNVYTDKIDYGFTADRTFIDAVKANDPYMVKSPYRDAYKTLEAVLAANESFKTGKVIEL